MGGAYSTGSTGIGSSGVGGNGSQPPGGGVARFPDSRSNNAGGAPGGQSALDQNSFPWLNLTRGGQLPPSTGGGNVGAPSLRGPQPPQLPQQQPQSGSQSGIEEIIASISRSNPNFLYSREFALCFDVCSIVSAVD